MSDSGLLDGYEDYLQELSAYSVSAETLTATGTVLPVAEKAKLLCMDRKLKKKIIGQDTAILTVCQAIKRSKVGFKDPVRPVGCFLFLGVSGCGKTELCKALAEVLYGNKKKLIKIDMSEYMAKWDVSKFIGASPGYVGYEQGGQLTNMIKQNPQAVLCFDEIEKAHPDVFNILLQIMEDGRLTSGQGETVSFKDILVIMTSNIGSDEICSTKSIGFGRNSDNKQNIKSKITASLKKTFKPEFLNRIDEVIMFSRLDEKHILQICKIMLKKVKQNAGKLNIKVDFDNTAITELARLGYDAEYGARPMRRVISVKIENMLADKIITEELNAGDEVRISYKKGEFMAEKKNAASIQAMEAEGLW